MVRLTRGRVMIRSVGGVIIFAAAEGVEDFNRGCVVRYPIRIDSY